MGKCQSIGFDLHGTINVNNRLWKQIIHLLIDSESMHGEIYNAIYIISGPPKEQIIQELDKYKLNPYNCIILSVVDYLKSIGCEMWQDEKGNWWADEDIWWSSKAELCRIHEIDYLFDDKKEYGEYFGPDHPTKFILVTQ